MTTLLFLWANVLFFSFHVAGHLYDMIANQPNWKSGDIADMKSYANFYRKSNPGLFFAPLVIGSVFVSLVCLILLWNGEQPAKDLCALAFLVSVAVFLITIRIFVPLNKYFFSPQELVPTELKRKVNLWIRLEYFRVTILIIGLVAAIWALNSYLGYD